MAKVACKHLVLVALFLLCFVSIGARARSLRVVNNNNEVQKQHQVLSTTKENEVPVQQPASKPVQQPASKPVQQPASGPVPNAEELIGLDYTAPRKKPPIHN